jgi:hypothetical protein
MQVEWHECDSSFGEEDFLMLCCSTSLESVRRNPKIRAAISISINCISCDQPLGQRESRKTTHCHEHAQSSKQIKRGLMAVQDFSSAAERLLVQGARGESWRISHPKRMDFTHT